MQGHSLGITFFALFCGMLVSSTEVRAQSTSTTTRTMNTTVPPKATKAWSLPISFEFDSTLHTQDSYERQAQESFGLAPSYHLSENWKLAATISLTKDESIGGDGNTTFDNTTVALSTSRPLTPTLKWQSAFGAVAPTNQEIREQTTFQGAAKLSTGVLFEGLIWSSALNYRASVTRNFHELDMSADGAFNIRESLGQSLDYEIPLSSVLSLLTSFSYIYARTYVDDMRTRFSVAAELSWSPIRNFSVAVGTSNDGSALQPNGRDSNIEFFNDNTSVIKLGLTYIL